MPVAPRVILCCGEALIDMIPERGVSGRMGFVPHCGGAALNTALGLGRHGAQVGLLTGLSSDPFGQQITEALKDARVDQSLIIASDRPTTLAFVHLGEEARFSFIDENSAGRGITISDMPNLPERVRCLLLGGISLCNQPAADVYETLCDRAAGRLVMLDPNIRPGFSADETAYRARLVRMIARAHIVKLSAADLDLLDPRPVAWRQKVDAVLAQGPVLVLLTRGDKGAVSCHQDGRCIAATTTQVQVTNTVGAGDAFNAGFLGELQKRDLLAAASIAGISPVDLQACLEHATQGATAMLARRAHG